MNEIEETIQEQVNYLEDNMPADIKNLIRIANSDLYNGPVYLDSEGKECSFLDEGAVGFNFKESCSRIATYFENVYDIRVETDYNEETGESYYEPVDGSAEIIITRILGKELAKYI